MTDIHDLRGKLIRIGGKHATGEDFSHYDHLVGQIARVDGLGQTQYGLWRYYAIHIYMHGRDKHDMWGRSIHIEDCLPIEDNEPRLLEEGDPYV